MVRLVSGPTKSAGAGRNPAEIPRLQIVSGGSGVGRTDADAIWTAIRDIERRLSDVMERTASKSDIGEVWTAIDGIRRETLKLSTAATRLTAEVEGLRNQATIIADTAKAQVDHNRVVLDHIARMETKQLERDRSAGFARWAVTTLVALVSIAAGFFVGGM